MTTVRELHDKAMELADAAIAAQRRSDINLARQLNREALACERQAALLVAKLGKFQATAIRARLQGTAADLGAPGADPKYGKGRLDVFRALQ